MAVSAFYPCDWSKGSFCATMAKIDITHHITSFLNISEASYNSFGCLFFGTEINQLLISPAASSVLEAKRKSKIDFFNCMAESCGCTPPIPANVYGCMDDGNMPMSYMNNTGTWDFSILNNTTSSGVVNQPDGTQLPGVQYGSPYSPIGTVTGAALNYDVDATVDDGSCIYPYWWMNWGAPQPTGWTPPKPYWLSGCMDGTPHDPLIHGFPAGFPDVNGHGTGAVYRCRVDHWHRQNPVQPITPQGIGDPCVYPCITSSGTGYRVRNYNPCANFSCHDEFPSSDPWSGKYSSDMNWQYTHHEDATGMGAPSGVNPPGEQVFRPFGVTSIFFNGVEQCCNYTPPDPQNPNPGLIYDFRCANSFAVGGCEIHSGPAIWDVYNTGNGPPVAGSNGHPDNFKIGDDYLMIYHNRADAVGNDWMGNDSDLVFGKYHQGGSYGYALANGGTTSLIPPIVGGQPPAWANDLQTINIKIYDIYENLIADYDYRWMSFNRHLCPASHGTSTGDPCRAFRMPLELISQNYPDPITHPNHVVDLSPHYGGSTYAWGMGLPSAAGGYSLENEITYENIGNPGRGYIQINCANSGTTSGPVYYQTQILPYIQNIPTMAHIGPPRIPSMHWNTTRGNTENLGLNASGVPLHWTGFNYRAHLATNPYPPWVYGLMNQVNYPSGIQYGYRWPHACSDCGTPNPIFTNSVNNSALLYYLEPGPNDQYPLKYLYHNTNYQIPSGVIVPTTTYKSYLVAYKDCGDLLFQPSGGTKGSLRDLRSEILKRDKSFGDCGSIITNYITYDEDENQEVTITSDIENTNLT